MKTFEHQLLALYADILTNGEHRADRTGTGTYAAFGRELRIDLQQGFPLLTTKRVFFKPVASELLWFLEGSGDERRLAEILHGTRDISKKTIWSKNAEAEYWTPNAKFSGDLGRVYGVQWRKWQKLTLKGSHGDTVQHAEGGETHFNARVLVEEVDQFKHLITALKTNPTDRRLVLSAWNPGELHQMALPPCHMFAQFYLSNDRKLSCQMYQRSADQFLGVPFNIASYALLTHMIAHVIGADVGELIMVFGDAHIYSDHIDQVKEQLTRAPKALPKLWLNPTVKNIDDFTMDSMRVDGYDPHPAISAAMST